VVQRGHPEIPGDPRVGDGDELQPRVLDLVLDRRGDDLTDPLTKALGPSVTRHRAHLLARRGATAGAATGGPSMPWGRAPCTTEPAPTGDAGASYSRGFSTNS